LLCAGCDDHKQRHLYKISWQPDRRIKKFPRSATHQTVNFEPLIKSDIYRQTNIGEKLFSQKLKQNNWHLSYQNNEKATSAKIFVIHQLRQLNLIEFAADA